MRVALVHDWLNQMGGAENVLEEMVDLFPNAPIYTSIFAPEKMPAAYATWPIQTTFMQHLPAIANHHQPYLPIYPLAFQKTDLSRYDLVLSNKSGFCHGVRTKRGTRRATHVCYCLTPTRFLWLYQQYREREQIGGVVNAALQPLLALLRRWDRAAAQRVDHFIAISSTVQERIRAIYGRESTIIYPPVDTDYFTPADNAASENFASDGALSDAALTSGEYYLIVSRLIPYKRIDLAVEAFRDLPHEKLLIVGDGRDGAELRATASDNVLFLGRQSRQQIRELLRHCKAFIFPGLEDFGIAPVEAMSVGRPVIAFRGGGALDTVLPAISGELFDEQRPESLLKLLRTFDPSIYSKEGCREQAQKFSVANFRSGLFGYLEKVVANEG